MISSISPTIFAAPSTPSATVQPTCEAVSFYSEDDISLTEKAQSNPYSEGKIKLDRILELIVKIRAMLENLFKSKNEKESAELSRQLPQVMATNQQWQDLMDEIKSVTIDDTSVFDEIDEFLVKQIIELTMERANQASLVSALEYRRFPDIQNDPQTLQRIKEIEGASEVSLNFLESLRVGLRESASPVNSIETDDENDYDAQAKFLSDLIGEAHRTLARPVSLAAAGAMFA